MKRLSLLLGIIAAVVFAAGALAAGPNPVSPPNSTAFGKSLDGWMGTFLRQRQTLPAVVGEKNVTFLPIDCAESPTCTFGPTDTGWGCTFTFDVTVAPGTALALPCISYLGWDTPDDFLPPECWGQPCVGPPPMNLREIFADATLDGQMIAEPSAAFYVGPTPFEPTIACPWNGEDHTCVLYHAIGAVIKPLPPGNHTLVLHSGMRGEDPGPTPWSLTYDNTWNIRVVPVGHK